MRAILILVILTVTCFDNFGQKKKDKPTKKEFEKAEKEFLKKVSKESNGELIAINPKLIDQFIKAVKDNDMDKVYSLVDNDIKQFQTKDDMTKIFMLYNQYFGKILSYEQTAFGIKTKGGFGQFATVGYNIDYEKFKGKGTGTFKIYNKDTVKMFSFNLLLDDYISVEAFDNIAKPTMDAIKTKDKKGIYNLTSRRFKEYNSIADFEEQVNKIVALDLKDSKMFRHELGIKKGNELLTIYYELKDSGYLQLTFTKLNDIFELEGVYYIPKE